MNRHSTFSKTAEAIRTGAEALIDSLRKAGVETIFGYPGGAVTDIFDCLRTSPLNFILGRHEQGCVHAADGYARALGRPGVALVTSGPGLTNTITALGAANMDGVPLVLVSGQVPLDQVGTDAFQEADATGITRAVSKHNFLVHSADEIPEIVAQAFYIATHGKPGPVVIDIPKNCQKALTSAQYPERVSLRAYHPESAASTSEANRFAKLINGAERPVLYAGGGVIAAGAAADVSALARKAGLPVATTLMGLGSFDEDDPLALGMAGIHGAYAANMAISECDVLIALGVRFNDRITGKVSKYAPKAKIIHVDCDPSSINKNVRVNLGIVADIKDLLTTVGSKIPAASHPEWLARIARWRDEHDGAWQASTTGKIMPQAAVESIWRATEGRAVVVTDVGQHQMWAAQYWHHSLPRHFLTSGGMGAMGFGIPAAIGASVALRGRKVIAILGDGGAQMTFQELAVAVEKHLPITFVIFNNGCLGMVRQLQELFHGNRCIGVSLQSKNGGYLPDFVRLARAYGIEAARVSRPECLDAAIRRAVGCRRPYLLEILIDPAANVYPMTPASKPMTEMIFEGKGGGA